MGTHSHHHWTKNLYSKNTEPWTHKEMCNGQTDGNCSKQGLTGSLRMGGTGAEGNAKSQEGNIYLVFFFRYFCLCMLFTFQQKKTYVTAYMSSIYWSLRGKSFTWSFWKMALITWILSGITANHPTFLSVFEWKENGMTGRGF